MMEAVVIQGDTGKVIVTGVNVSRVIDFSKYKPGQVIVSPYRYDSGLVSNQHEIKVDFK
jgi:hypothetical protein